MTPNAVIATSAVKMLCPILPYYSLHHQETCEKNFHQTLSNLKKIFTKTPSQKSYLPENQLYWKISFTGISILLEFRFYRKIDFTGNLNSLNASTTTHNH